MKKVYGAKRLPKDWPQLVFCDLSGPTNGHGFLVYEDMRDKLLVRGVPAGEMAFIQDPDRDAVKLQLFRAVRAGRVRILFGSTPPMGPGANGQQRLVALHHLDAPWRGHRWREGRGLRCFVPGRAGERRRAGFHGPLGDKAPRARRKQTDLEEELNDTQENM